MMIRVSCALFLLAILASCSAEEPSGSTPAEYRDRIDNMSETELEEFLIEAAPTSQAAARLQAAFSDPDMPSIKDVPIPRQFMEIRKRPSFNSQTELKRKRPVIDKRLVADVRLWSELSLVTYDGPATVTNVAPGQITAMLRGVEQPVELLFVTPSGDRLPDVSEKTKTLDLRVVDTMSEFLSMNREIILAEENMLHLAQFSIGGSAPVEIVLPKHDLKIRQLTEKGLSGKVEISLGNTRVIAEQAIPVKMQTDAGVYGAYLKSEYAVKTLSGAEEGDPFHIVLTVWRIE